MIFRFFRGVVAAACLTLLLPATSAGAVDGAIPPDGPIPASTVPPASLPAALPDLDTRAAVMAPQVLSALLAGEGVTLFDVRSRAEYAVSHISGAIRIDDNIDRPRLVARIARDRRRIPVVFYCTTMGRSQLVADAILHDLAAVGFGRPNVLAGGLVAWANSRLPMVDAKGATDRIHPHDPETAKLVADPSRVSYGPFDPFKQDGDARAD